MATTTATRIPWGITRITRRLPLAPLGYASITLDPGTQTARFHDQAGQPLDMGKHGSNSGSPTTSKSQQGGDGNTAGPNVDDDSTTGYGTDD